MACGERSVVRMFGAARISSPRPIAQAPRRRAVVSIDDPWPKSLTKSSGSDAPFPRVADRELSCRSSSRHMQSCSFYATYRRARGLSSEPRPSRKRRSASMAFKFEVIHHASGHCGVSICDGIVDMVRRPGGSPYSDRRRHRASVLCRRFDA